MSIINLRSVQHSGYNSVDPTVRIRTQPEYSALSNIKSNITSLTSFLQTTEAADYPKNGDTEDLKKLVVTTLPVKLAQLGSILSSIAKNPEDLVAYEADQKRLATKTENYHRREARMHRCDISEKIAITVGILLGVATVAAIVALSILFGSPLWMLAIAAVPVIPVIAGVGLVYVVHQLIEVYKYNGSLFTNDYEDRQLPTALVAAPKKLADLESQKQEKLTEIKTLLSDFSTMVNSEDLSLDDRAMLGLRALEIQIEAIFQKVQGRRSEVETAREVGLRNLSDIVKQTCTSSEAVEAWS